MQKRVKRLAGWLFVIVGLLCFFSACTSEQKSVVISLVSEQEGMSCDPTSIEIEPNGTEEIELPTPTLFGYEFTGWYTDKECTEEVVSPLQPENFPTKSTKYWAGFYPLTYVVTFKAGSKVIDTRTVGYEETIYARDYPSLEAYPGYSWNLKTLIITESVTLEAIYTEPDVPEEKPTYSVTFYVDDDVYYTLTAEEGTEFTLPNNPEAESGTYFYGWAFKKNATGSVSVSNTVSSKDMVYYALFRSLPDASGYLLYKINDDGRSVTLTGLTEEGKFQSSLGIPSEIDGMTVTSIGYEDTDGTSSVASLKVFSSQLLEAVSIPSTVTTVGAWAFADCTALSDIVFQGTNLGYIGVGAFAGCTSLGAVTLTDNVTVVDKFAFGGITTVKTATPLPKEVLSELPSAWSKQNWYATDMHVSSVFVNEAAKLSSVGAYAFYKCVYLSSMTLPSVIREINYLSFTGSTLERLNISEGGSLASIDGVVYVSNKKTLVYYPVHGDTEFTVPDTVLTVGENAFRGNVTLEKVHISSAVETIGVKAFADCERLAEVLFTEDSRLTTIAESAFNNCLLLDDVTLPASLLRLDDYAFDGDTGLKTVTFAGNILTAIGNYSFRGCTALERVGYSSEGLYIIPAPVERVGNYAFYGCTSLSLLAFDANSSLLNYIGDYAFYGCTALGNISFPTSLRYLGDYSFCNCSSMEPAEDNFTKLEYLGERAFSGSAILGFTIRNAILSAEDATAKYGKSAALGKYAFADCKRLWKFSFSNNKNYTAVPEGFLKGCVKLTQVTFTDNITVIEDYAMYGCSGLETVTFYSEHSNITKIGKEAFAYCTSFVSGNNEKRVLPETLTELGEGAFRGCTALRQATVPSGLNVLSKRAFADCTSLVSLSFDSGSSLHTLDEECFADCVSLESVDLPASLGLREDGQGFVKNPFIGCASLNAFSFGQGNENGLVAVDGVIYTDSKKTNIYAYPTAKAGESKSLSGGGTVQMYYVSGVVQKISDYAFYGTTLEALDFKVADGSITLVSIGGYAFAESSLKNINLSDRVVEVGEHAFENCPIDVLTLDNNYYDKDSKTLVGGDNNTMSVGGYAFRGTEITEVALPQRVCYVGDGAFSECYRLSGVAFVKNISSVKLTDDDLVIGDGAFKNDVALISITLPARLKTLGNYAFSNCYNMEQVKFDRDGTLADTETTELTIGDYAFYENHFIYEIDLPDNVVSFGKGAFSNNSRLTYFNFPDKLTKTDTLVISEEAFMGDSQLDALTIPSYVSEIGEKAYYKAKIRTLVFEGGDCDLVIGDYAFGETVYLTSVYLPDNCVEVGNFAFSGSGLKVIEYGTTYYRFALQEDWVSGTSIPSGSTLYVKSGIWEKTSDTVAQEGTEYFTVSAYADYTINTAVGSDVCQKYGAVYRKAEGQYVSGVQYYRVQSFTSVPVGSDLPDGTELYVQLCFEKTTDTRYKADSVYYTVTECSDLAVGTPIGKDICQKYGSGYKKVEGVYAANLTFGEGAFAGTALETVTVTQRIEGIGASVFADIPSLSVAYIDGSFLKIEDGAFRNDTGLKVAVIGTHIKEIGAEAFLDSGIEAVVDFGNVSGGKIISTECTLSVRSVGDGAFSGSMLRLFRTDSGAEALSVGEEAFRSCEDLVELSFKTSSDLTVDAFAFADNAAMSLLKLHCDGSMALASGFALSATSLYKGFAVEGAQTDYIYEDGNLFDADRKTLVFYPAGKTGAVLTLSSGVNAVGGYALYGNTYLTGLMIENILTVIPFDATAFSETNENLTVYVSSNMLTAYKNSWESFSALASFTEKVDDYILTIQNSGQYYVTDYLGSESNLVIRASLSKDNKKYEVGGIGQNAFMNNTYLETVTVSAGIKVISNSAFRGCTSLRSVTVGENVTGIKNYAFYGCTSLQTISFSENSSVVNIGNYAFAGCLSLTEIALPSGVETIGSYCFSGDRNLASVSMAEGILELKNNAFENCVALLRVQLPSSVETIGNYLFRNCSNLIYVDLPATEVPSLENSSFTGTPEGIYFFVPSQSYRAYCVDNKWRDYINKIIIREYIYHDEDADSDYNNYVVEPLVNGTYRLVAYIDNRKEVNLQSVLPDGKVITEIGENAFAKDVEQITVGDGILSVNSKAFAYADNLKQIELPYTLTTIGTSAFAGRGRQTNKLQTVTIREDVVYIDVTDKARDDRNIWLSVYNSYYVKNNEGEYVAATRVFNAETKYYSSVRKSMLQKIGANAFYNCTSLQSFSVPTDVTEIGQYAFSCDEDKEMKMEQVTFLHNDTDGSKDQSISIGAYAFARNTELLRLEFNCYVSYFGEGAFAGCSTLKVIYLNYYKEKAARTVTVDKDTDNIFEACDKLLIVVPNAEVLGLYKKNWYNQFDINRLISSEYVVNDFAYEIIATKDKTVTLLGYLGAENPDGEGKLSVTIPSTVKLPINGTSTECSVIRVGRKNNNSSLHVNGNVISNRVTEVVIPGTVATIGADAFRSCTGLTTVLFSGVELTTIEESAFRDCPSLRTISLPINLTTVGSYAFAGCTSLNGSYNVEEGLQFASYIGEIDKTEKTIVLKEYAFYGCTSLTTLIIPRQLLQVGTGAFMNCTSLSDFHYDKENFYLDGTLLGEQYVQWETVGAYAFANTALTEIELPETVSSVGSYAFSDCQKLLSVYLNRNINNSSYTSCTSADETVFFGVKSSHTKVYVPADCLGNYSAIAGWSQKTVVACNIFGDYSYEITGDNTVTLTSYRGTELNLTIPAYFTIGGVTYYPTAIAAYFGNPNLEKIEFSPLSRVTRIMDYAFAGCNNLQEIHLPGSKTGDYLETSEDITVGQYAFYGCSSLTDVHLPKILATVSAYMFQYCTSLVELTLPDTVILLGNGCLFGCSKLARLRIHSGNAALGTTPFAGAGKDVEGGLRIIVPSQYVQTITNAWIQFDAEGNRIWRSDDYFTVYSDELQFGDYLVEQEGDRYKLIQYLGNAETVSLSDMNFGGKELASVDNPFLGEERTASYGDFTLIWTKKGWILTEYRGTDDLDLTSLTILGMAFVAVSDDAVFADGDVTVTVDGDITCGKNLDTKVNLINTEE